MILYTWVVMKDCRIAGYVKAHSEWDAMRIAQEQYGDRLFVERVYLGDWVSASKETS
jgi:hypothetical protein